MNGNMLLTPVQFMPAALSIFVLCLVLGNVMIPIKKKKANVMIVAFFELKFAPIP